MSLIVTLVHSSRVIQTTTGRISRWRFVVIAFVSCHRGWRWWRRRDMRRRVRWLVRARRRRVIIGMMHSYGVVGWREGLVWGMLLMPRLRVVLRMMGKGGCGWKWWRVIWRTVVAETIKEKNCFSKKYL